MTDREICDLIDAAAEPLMRLGDALDAADLPGQAAAVDGMVRQLVRLHREHRPRGRAIMRAVD